MRSAAVRCGFRVADVLRAAAPALQATAAMLAVAGSFKLAAGRSLSPAQSLPLIAALGCIAYTVALAAMFPAKLAELKRFAFD